MSIRKKIKIYGNRLQETGNPSLCIPEQKIVKTREGKRGDGGKENLYRTNCLWIKQCD